MKIDFAAWQTPVRCVGKDHFLLSERSFSIALQCWKHFFNLTSPLLRPRENTDLMPYEHWFDAMRTMIGCHEQASHPSCGKGMNCPSLPICCRVRPCVRPQPLYVIIVVGNQIRRLIPDPRKISTVPFFICVRIEELFVATFKTIIRQDITILSTAMGPHRYLWGP